VTELTALDTVSATPPTAPPTAPPTELLLAVLDPESFVSELLVSELLVPGSLVSELAVLELEPDVAELTVLDTVWETL
jgi:hypothetical protein